MLVWNLAKEPISGVLLVLGFKLMIFQSEAKCWTRLLEYMELYGSWIIPSLLNKAL